MEGNSLQRSPRAIHKIVSTEEFWEAMGDPAFIRISRHNGAARGIIYHTKVAPEDEEGFMDRQRQLIMEALGAPPRPRNVLIDNVIAYGSAALIVLGVIGFIKLMIV